MKTQKVEPKILFLDLENAPNTSYVWGKYEQNTIENVEDWYILCISWKWFGEKETKTVSLTDFPEYKKDKTNDRGVVEVIWERLNAADVVIGHNAAEFDLKKINARMLHWGLTPPSQYKVIDTLKVARKYFQFDSNKLNDLCQYLGLGQKVETGGFQLWKDCMVGDVTAWGKMVKYNKMDVLLLEKLYNRLLPWIDTFPIFSAIVDDPKSCVSCGSKKIVKRGMQLMVGGKERQRFVCQDCGKWFCGKVKKIKALV